MHAQGTPDESADLLRPATDPPFTDSRLERVWVAAAASRIRLSANLIRILSPARNTLGDTLPCT